MAKYHNHSKAEIQEILRTIIDPVVGGLLCDDKSLSMIDVDQDKVSLSLTKGYPIYHAKNQIDHAIKQTLSEKLGLNESQVNLSLNLESRIKPHSQNHAVSAIKNVGNLIAVSSGKGGVGKSTVSANIAIALQQQGARVGLLDADIYGPSQPGIFSLTDKPEMKGDLMLPLEKFGIQLMSIGLMIDQDTPMIWRGPMVTQALEQMLRKTAWPELDYLILDLPPGTGDVQLTLAQKTPMAGAVVVTTPQDIALLDVRKAIKMFEKVEVPIIGIIENMSTHICSQCQHEEAIFGQGGGEVLASEYDVSQLGSIPLDITIRQAIDGGLPIVAKVIEKNDCEPREKRIAEIYHDIALALAGNLAVRKKDYRSLFPNIEISNT